MADPFVGEVRAFGFSFAPRNWAFCDGQLLPVAQNTQLFSILGSMYGGDARITFGLPNLKGSAPMHWGQGPGLTPRDPGEALGEEGVTLIESQIPSHVHGLNGATVTNASQKVAEPAAGAMFSNSTPGQAYSQTTTPQVPFSPKAIGPAGQSQPHENAQPRLALNFCIALAGIYPSRN